MTALAALTGPRLAVLTTLTMLAFAGNSVLNRMAISQAGIDPGSFALLRVGAGALVLALLALGLGKGLPLARPGRWAGAAALSAYLLGFSLAYVALDAGLGALILFGMVQVTMFAGALVLREPIPPRRWVGAGLALAGLGWLLWPDGGLSMAAAGSPPGNPSPVHVALMVLAAVGWGLYSLLGRGANEPLAATAASFVLALPMVLLVLLLMPGSPPVWSALWLQPPLGVALALTSGAVTSGLGYALWYAVLPSLGSARAAVAQLGVPVLAALGGAALLAEAPGLRFWTAAALVTAGVALASLPAARRPAG